MSDPHALAEDGVPLVACAFHALRNAPKGSPEPFHFPEAGERLLESAVRALVTSREPHAVKYDKLRRLLALSFSLAQREACPTAAQTITNILADDHRVGEVLGVETRSIRRRNRRLERFLGAEEIKRAPRVDGKRPDGALGLASFLQPGQEMRRQSRAAASPRASGPRGAPSSEPAAPESRRRTPSTTSSGAAAASRPRRAFSTSPSNPLSAAPRHDASSPPIAPAAEAAPSPPSAVASGDRGASRTEAPPRPARRAPSEVGETPQAPETPASDGPPGQPVRRAPSAVGATPPGPERSASPRPPEKPTGPRPTPARRPSAPTSPRTGPKRPLPPGPRRPR